jgi:hypothetical protein
MGGLFVALALALAGCSNASTNTGAVDAVLLHASDVPGMRLAGASAVLTDKAVLEETLGHGEVFKIEPSEIGAKLAEWGFVRAHLEQYLGGGTHAQTGVFQFGSPADAQTALAFMFQQLFEQCPGQPQCSRQLPLSVPDIPGAKGQVVTPFRPATIGKPVTDYKVLFAIGPLVYAIDIGGDDGFYDPGTVSKDTALAVFKDVYERVKGLAPDALFKAVPARPLGQPPGGGPLVSGSPPPPPSP